jgi:hypothetical protein
MLRTNHPGPVPSAKPAEPSCPICRKELASSENVEQHLKSADHNKLAILAEKYINSCLELNLNPVSCSKEELEKVFGKIEVKTLDLLQVSMK